MQTLDINNLIENHTNTIIYALLGLIVLVVLIFYLLRYLKKTSDQRRIKKILAKNSKEYLKDVVLSDGINGYLFIEYLILLRGKIVAMDTRYFAGHIFGGEHIDQWTQVVDGKTSKFPNPLQCPSLFVQHVKHLINDSKIEACVLFGSKSTFPKGIPPGVFRLENLENNIETLNRDTEMRETIKKAWSQLVETAAEDKQRYLQDKHS
jgi:hypothetical protein